MDKTNQIINGLWVGNQLSPIELLTLCSFTDHGHIFHLWVYEELENVLPKGVILKDANEIIPESKIFRKKEADPKFSIGKGSLATFSDLFRYKLLYEKGGWWVDMDISCLKPFNSQDSYFFRSHPLLPMIGNVMKCPKGSELMKLVYEEVNEKCNENTTEWLLTNKILNQHIQSLNLQSYIKKDMSNNDDWLEIKGLIYTNEKQPKNWYCIHWMNEEWRTRNLKKNEVYKYSFLHSLYLKYQIPIHVKKKDHFKGYVYWIQRKNRQARSLLKKLLGLQGKNVKV